jgi:UDP-N-acetylmuramoylalanine--D-glutamate ligase
MIPFQHNLPHFLLKKPVAVLGYGVSGQAVVESLVRLKWAYAVYDEQLAEGVSRDFTTQLAHSHHLVIYSPGFPENHPWLRIARSAGCTCMGEFEFASKMWLGSRIAVTGTTGKTFVSGFLAQAFKRMGKDALVVGSNGFAVSNLVGEPQYEGVIAVCEVSSFQAESLQLVPLDALIWTNFSEEHLERHQDLRAYFSAKWKLVSSLRTPMFFIDESVEFHASRFGYPLPDYTVVIRSADEEKWDFPLTSAFSNPAYLSYLLLVRKLWEQMGLSMSILRQTAEQYRVHEDRFKNSLR